MSDANVKEGNNSGHNNEKEDKTITIYVEATPHLWPKGKEICHLDVVKLEVANYDPQTTYSVKYKKGNGNKPEGVLPPESCIKAKEGMVFSVSETGQS